MWQRIQTVLVVLAMIGLILTLTLPLIQVITTEASTSHTAFDLIGSGDAIELMASWAPVAIVALALVSLVVLAFSITQFKNLPRQIKINRIATLLIMGCMVCLFFGLKDVVASEVATRKVGFFAPAVSLFLNVLAGIQMRRDHMKIASVDRIR